MRRLRCGPCGQHEPRVLSFVAANVAHVVATKTGLLRDAESGFDRGIGRVATRSDGGEEGFFSTELEADDSPGNLPFFYVREDLKRRRELAVRNQVWPHVVAVAFGIFRPAIWRLAVNPENEQRVMIGEITARVVSVIAVIADGDDESGIRIAREGVDKIFEKNSADFGGSGEVWIVANGEGRLRQSEQVFAGEISGGAGGKALQIAADGEIGRGLALGMSSGDEAGRRACGRNRDGNKGCSESRECEGTGDERWHGTW